MPGVAFAYCIKALLSDCAALTALIACVCVVCWLALFDVGIHAGLHCISELQYTHVAICFSRLHTNLSLHILAVEAGVYCSLCLQLAAPT